MLTYHEHVRLTWPHHSSDRAEKRKTGEATHIYIRIMEKNTSRRSPTQSGSTSCFFTVKNECGETYEMMMMMRKTRDNSSRLEHVRKTTQHLLTI